MSTQVSLSVVINNTSDQEVNCLDALTQVMEHFGLNDRARDRVSGWLYDRYGRGQVETVVKVDAKGLEPEELTRWAPPD